MVFNDEQRKRLEEAWKNREEITIYGVNSLGDEFVTTGRISTTDHGKSGIQDLITEDNENLGQAIYLEFGMTKDDSYRKQTSYFAPYRTNLSNFTMGTDLYILNVTDEQDNELYLNDDADKILEATKLEGEKKAKKLKEQGRYISDREMDPVTKELKKMIGKPIILSYIENGSEVVEERCVLGSVGGSSNFGSTMLDVLSGPLCGAIHVDKNHVLRTEDNNGKVSDILARNNETNYDVHRAFKARVDNINAAKNK